MKTIKKTLAAGVVVVLAWFGYSRGYHHGVQDERQAWQATGQPEQVGTVTLNNESARIPNRTVYRNPHSGVVAVVSRPGRALNGLDHVE